MSSKITIAAVVVLYRRKYHQTDTYKSLLNSWKLPILIYDNSPKPQKFNLSENEYYISNPENPGVSKAYNFAVNWAKQKNCTHILLLDSDSKFPDNAANQYSAKVVKCPNSIIFPAMFSGNHKISPFYFKWGKSYYGDKINFGQIQLGTILGINSGALIPLSAFNETTKFNENLPLDWSDVAFFRNLADYNINSSHVPIKVSHGLSAHETQSIKQAIYRYTLYIKGIKYVSKNIFERLIMLFWAKLKAFKLSIRYKNFRFISLYLKHLNG